MVRINTSIRLALSHFFFIHEINTASIGEAETTLAAPSQAHHGGAVLASPEPLPSPQVIAIFADLLRSTLAGDRPAATALSTRPRRPPEPRALRD
jgi:hypothetical protein